MAKILIAVAEPRILSYLAEGFADHGNVVHVAGSIDDVIDHLAVELGHIADIIRLEQQAETSKRP